MDLEIERKFILKFLPDKEPDDRIFMHQYYCKIDDVWERVRSMTYESTGKVKHVHTVKTSVSDEYSAAGANLELEKEISKKEFEEFRKMCYSSEFKGKFITKTRHLYKHKDRIWEVDKFHEGCSLIVAEVEIPSMTYSLCVPKFISKCIIYEVTGIKEFSNKNLSFII